MTKTRVLSILLRILKFFGITLAIILILFGVVSWVVVQKKNDWLLDQIQSFMTASQSGQLKISSLDLKLFRSFPDVTLELTKIDYYLHRDSLRTSDEEPILHAEQLFVAIELLPLIREELNVSEINITKAQLNIIEFKNGVLNLEMALAKPTKAKPKVATKIVTPKPPVTATRPKEKQVKPTVTPSHIPSIQIDLENISLSDILLTWRSHGNPSPSIILIKEVEADILTQEEELIAKLRSTYQIQVLTIRDTELPQGNLAFSTDLRYARDLQLLTIEASEINYDIFSATLKGTYAHQKNRMLDVQVDASANDLQLLSLLIKPEVVKKNPNLLKNGDIYIMGRVFGELRNQLPQVEISFGVNDLDLQLPKQLGAFKEIGFKGTFTSGSKSDFSQARFEINNLKGQLPGGFLKGQFHVRNFVEPYLTYKIDTRIKLDGYDEVFKLNFLKQLTGTVSLKANFDGPLKLLGQHSMDSSRSSAITLDNLSFIVAKTNQSVSGLSGKIETRDNQTELKHLAFAYGKNDLTVNATIDNLMYLLFKQESNISITGNLQSNAIFTKDFILDTLLSARVQDKISNLSFDFKAKTSANKTGGKSGLPDVAFEINNLNCKLDELPDIKRVDTKGLFIATSDGLKLSLHEFQAIMPYGKLNVTGDLFIPEKKLWQFNAKVKANKFPWTYVMELVAEIQNGKEPTSKNLPISKMEIVTADLDLSASVITFPFDITKLDVRNSRIHFAPPDSKPISVEKMNVALENLLFTHPKNSGAITGLKSTRGTLELMQLSVPGLNKFDIKMNVTGKDDQLDIQFSSATQKAKSEKGEFTMDFSKKEFEYQLRYAVQGADLESFIKKYYKKKLMVGDIDYLLDLHATGSSWASTKKSLMGEIVITGDSLKLFGVDVDNALRKYEKSQNFNLTDLGAVVIAGPIGLAVTKGSDFVSLATINLDPAQMTVMQTLVAKWKLENRQLITQDVAFATSKNRIAFDGRIDFATDSIPGITIAVIDKQGCSLMDQRLYGKMGVLKTGKLNITKTVLGSVINFVNAVVGKDCRPVYTGMVQDPLH